MARTGQSLIRRIENLQGDRAFELFLRDDGLYRFAELRLVCDELDGSGEPLDPYWSPAVDSGLYETAAEAEDDARTMIGWLNDRSPN